MQPAAKPLSLYLVAGERSGDQHAAHLLAELMPKLPAGSKVRGVAGLAAQAQGMDLFLLYSEVAIMGILEVLTNLGKLLGALRRVKADITYTRPDAIILVDFGGFNLRLARWCKGQGIPVHYYITPKVWAWNTGRVRQIARYVDYSYVILPFEKTFFDRHGVDSDYIGSPVLDQVEAYQPDPTFRQRHGLAEDLTVALLPGSRRQEVEANLAIMAAAAHHFPNLQFVIAGVDNLPPQLYQAHEGRLRVIIGDTYGLLSNSVAAIVCSGTATLETALFSVPQVVCYRSSWLTYRLAKWAIKVPYISLVNLIAVRELVPELIQDDFTEAKVSLALSSILPGQPEREAQLIGYADLRTTLGPADSARRAAALMQSRLQAR